MLFLISCIIITTLNIQSIIVSPLRILTQHNTIIALLHKDDSNELDY
jgi:hypothetical protein